MSQTTKIIYCQRSGVPLLEVTTLCSNGWALLSQPLLTTLVHTIYDAPLDKLLRKLELQLAESEKNEWQLTPVVYREIGLTMSAIMYSLDSMWCPVLDAIRQGRNIEPSLPGPKIVAGCAGRLLELAGWYQFETSKRIKFPLWKPSRVAGNLNWHGFSSWLDACFDIREEWSKARRKVELRDLPKAVDDALATVHMSQVYKRIDLNKVWNWIEVQSREHAGKYPAGRRETLKSLFMTGDSFPENWVHDDVDDLAEMILDTCDVGNDITHFVRTRLNNIREGITEFYRGFTLIGNASATDLNSLDLSETEQAAQKALFSEYDNKLDNLKELPPKPLAESYSNKIMFLRATAEWNILNRRFESRAKPQA